MSALFAAVHESVNGPSRHIALPHELGRYRGKADIAFRLITPPGLWVHGLTLLWQIDCLRFFKDLFSAVRTPLSSRPQDEIDDGVAYGGHGWLRRRPVDSFFSAPRMRGDDVAGRRRQSLSSERGDEALAMIAPRSDQVQAPLSTADAPARKSIVP